MLYFTMQEKHNSPLSPVRADWQSLVNRLKKNQHAHHDRDQHVAQIMGAKMKPREQWIMEPNGNAQRPENVESLSLMIFELNNPNQIEEQVFKKNIQTFLTEVLAKANYALFPTFEHSANTSSYRLIIPLSQPIAAQDWLDAWTVVAAAVDADPRKNTLSSAFSLPVIDKRRWPNEDPPTIINHGASVSPNYIRMMYDYMSADIFMSGERYQQRYQQLVDRRLAQPPERPSNALYIQAAIGAGEYQYIATGILHNDPSRALTQLNRDPVMINAMRERFKQTITTYQMMQQIAYGLINKYTPCQLSCHTFTELSLELLSELPSTDHQLDKKAIGEIFQSAHHLWAKNNNIHISAESQLQTPAQPAIRKQLCNR